MEINRVRNAYTVVKLKVSPYIIIYQSHSLSLSLSLLTGLFVSTISDLPTDLQLSFEPNIPWRIDIGGPTLKPCFKNLLYTNSTAITHRIEQHQPFPPLCARSQLCSQQLVFARSEFRAGLIFELIIIINNNIIFKYYLKINIIIIIIIIIFY